MSRSDEIKVVRRYIKEGRLTLMIIQTDGDAFLFITQPDHAALAAEAIAHWQDDGFAAHPRREDILLAVREHDNGWLEEDAATHVDEAGMPLDFVSVPVHVRQRIWPRAVDRLAERSPYAAALVAQHAITVYGTTRADPGWHAFFERMAARRDARRAEAGMDAATLDADYRFVNAADRISLAFCTGWRTPLESYGRRIILSGQAIVEISPDPFAGARVPLVVTARQLPQRAYTSAAALQATLDAAPAVRLTGVAAGAP